jgi:serine/threonine-protein kinase HipA
LLPDDDKLLQRWGQRFQVSARNPFRLLAHVGEECAGAVQFVRPERIGATPAGGVNWLDEEELAQRIKALLSDHAQARRAGDAGHFSLAGAQPKTGLYRDPATMRWGIPHGTTPTTHILKPAPGAFASYEQNEHFCLKLARAIGLTTAHSWIESFGDIPTIIVERFDRTIVDGSPVRIHQEDTCQALARMPHIKYQNQGGPSAEEIFELIRDHSAKLHDDVNRFLDALVFNYLIAGTDAHSKNYGFLLGGGGQTRLAPLYDLSSVLPYPVDIQPKKAKLAMKIGGQYRHYRIGPQEWEKAAREWKLDRDHVFAQIVSQAERLPDAAESIEKEMASGSEVIERLVEEIAKSAKMAGRAFSAE